MKHPFTELSGVTVDGEGSVAPEVAVGLLLTEKLVVKFVGDYFFNDLPCPSDFIAQMSGDLIESSFGLHKELLFKAANDKSYFILQDVVIGLGFHWERKESQSFKSDLRLQLENGKIRVVNLIDVENYLESVISSEMSPTASLSLLKSHSVISRSWLLYPLQNKDRSSTEAFHHQVKDGEWIRWYERDAHLGFDVCADDHCQRYQGIAKIVDEKALRAVRETRGLVLTWLGKICDARFSKCCGGRTEIFENCWDDVHFDYLLTFADKEGLDDFGQLSSERDFRNFQNTCPDVWCNTSDEQILGQVLNDYDRETKNFFRWDLEYTQTELADLIMKRSGVKFGRIKKLQALTRSESGRIIRLKIEGEFQSLIIGKELEIRKWLSNSHLYSSAFYVETENSDSEYPAKFKFKGLGWGHGVGLCQIGAAVMGENNKTFVEILGHYYPNTQLMKIY